MRDIGTALVETIAFFVRWRLLSAKTWVVIVALYEYHYAVTHNFAGPQLGVVGATLFLAIAAHVWGQLRERQGAGRAGDQ
jgi:hypothetical protein